MKTSALRRSIWIGAILIGGLILLPAHSVQVLGYGLGLTIPGLAAILLGLYGLCDAFELLGIDSRPDPPQLVSAAAILASVALVLYGLFLVLPWGLVTWLLLRAATRRLLARPA